MRIKQATAYIKIKNGYSGYKLARHYSKATLLYRSDQPFQVNLRADNYVNDYVLNPAYSIGKYTWSISPQKSIKISFTKGKFPTVYGVALDGAKGVAVDNFAMRGSSALGFDKMNKGHYSSQLKELNVRCVVLQYGINVVPNVRSDYGYYKKILVRQLNSIKAAYPGVSIIVIGPSDMSKNNGGQKVSYTNVPLIRDAMKEAAFETGSCFWDLYEAMGGKNSMVAWVNKGLARKLIPPYDDTYFMKQALRQAEMAYAEDEVPIGAIVVANNQIIGKGYNQVEKLNDPTAHAEMLAITAASSYLNSKFLNECELYVTVEPCVMCYGAIKNARIKMMYVGCLEPKHGFTNFVSSQGKLKLKQGVMEAECSKLMTTFFESKR